MAMKKVLCPKSGKMEWANLRNKPKDPEWRCTKCGLVHGG